MKEGIGATQLFFIVVILIIAFASVMSFTVNHSNAFAIKDKIVSIIEDAGGLDITSEIASGVQEKDYDDDQDVIQEIINVLDERSYRSTGKCELSTDTKEIQGYTRTGSSTSGNDASFCIEKISSGEMYKLSEGNEKYMGYVYKVVLFYSLDIPVVKQYFKFSVTGETKMLYR